MTAIMGILNVTPDSFSDGGRFASVDDAIAAGVAMFADGAAIVDVGGESTRPGAVTVPDDVEIERVVPVVEGLAAHGRVSIDTRHAAVAEAAIAAGATLLNDVSSSLHEVAAAAGVGWVAMHMQGAPQTMQANPSYDDVVTEVRNYLVEKAELGRAAGVEEIWIDPGIGFGKTTAHNLSIIKHLDVLVDTGWPVLIGASRKRFLGELTANSDEVDTVPTSDRLEASLGVATWATARGVQMLRVHAVEPHLHATKVVTGTLP